MILINNEDCKRKLLELADVLENIALALKDIALTMTPKERSKLGESIKAKRKDNL